MGPHRGAARLLHDNFTGLSLLIRDGRGNDREFWRDRPPLMVVFSFELDHAWTEHLPIIETPRYNNVLSVRWLVRDYAARVGCRHRRAPRRAFTPADRRVLARALAGLSAAPLETAVDGFFCAVAVCLDSLSPHLRLVRGGRAHRE